MGNLVGYIKEVALERKTCKLEGTMAKTRKQEKKKKKAHSGRHIPDQMGYL